VIHESTGRVVLSFAEKTKHSTVGIIEMRTLTRCLQLMWGLSLDKIVAEGDDLVLAQLRLRGEETQIRIPIMMHEEIALLCWFRGRDIRHVNREGNSVAHTLCRQVYEDTGV
jgi:hypothetical protein